MKETSLLTASSASSLEAKKLTAIIFLDDPTHCLAMAFARHAQRERLPQIQVYINHDEMVQHSLAGKVRAILTFWLKDESSVESTLEGLLDRCKVPVHARAVDRFPQVRKFAHSDFDGAIALLQEKALEV